MTSSKVYIFSPKDKEECQDAVTLLQQEKVIALDSEGVQLGKDGPLTLLQIGTLDGRVYLFDVMKNERKQDKDFFTDTSLDQILTSTDIVKVIQSCSGDSAALYHQFGIKLKNVFDTQVAHLVIKEKEGRRLPSRVKLAEICKLYSKNAEVYKGKEDVKIQWNKLEGNFWAKQPMTEEMIEYASGDVTALIPEVYEAQKEYIKAKGLGALFAERVKEEIEYEIDPEGKERRKKRGMAITREILQEMAAKYQMGTVFTDISDEDEIRVLNDANMKHLTDLGEVMKDLKLQSMECFLKSVEDQLKEPETFNPDRSLPFKLSDIERCGSDTLQNEAIRVKINVVQVVAVDVQKKYTADTPVENLSKPEYQIIRPLKPFTDGEPEYPPTVVALHWKITEKEIKEAIEKLNTDPDYNMTFTDGKLRFLTKDSRVPAALKRSSQTLLDIHEKKILEGIRSKYNVNTEADELSHPERMVLERLSLKHLTDLGEVMKDLKLQSMECFLKSVEDQLKEPETFNPDRSLPFKLSDIERCGSDTLQNEATRVKRNVVQVVAVDVQNKYTADTPVENLSKPEYQIIRGLKPFSDGEPEYPPTVVALHWKITEKEIKEAIEKLNTDPDYNMTFTDGKLRFLTKDSRVPAALKRSSQTLLDSHEKKILEGIRSKYNVNTEADELSHPERMVLERLRLSSRNDDPINFDLHWKVIHKKLSKDLEDYLTTGTLTINEGFRKMLNFFKNDKSVPVYVKQKAAEFFRALPNSSQSNRGRGRKY